MFFCPSVTTAQERLYEWRSIHPMLMVMVLAFWGVVVVGIVLAIRWLVSPGKGPRSADGALDILRQRYARGEINKEEFEAKKRARM